MPIADEVPSPVIPLSDKASCSGANKLQSPIVSHQDDNVDPIEPQEDVKITRETFILHEDILQRGAMEEIGATVIATYIEVPLYEYAIKVFTAQNSKQGRKVPNWKVLKGTPRQPTNVECGYYYIGNVQNMQVLDIAGSV
ncbi:hypothetical protein L3X38_034797 [Prunus dulcis]|uniref:Uncharacterized protein n=1 Tax=Prunus dulcis TaxID=3755 RepID=A0AAD4VJV8_PRUDU|nr:hypothetical protein L3X38_034797 [Prunus dulcis]